MSYGSPAEILPLEKIHVACLSGDNGHGKSAIMDAITWVLWGKTRISGTQGGNDDNLVRLGAEQMEVVLEFSAANSIYRITKRKTRGKPPAPGDWQIAEKLDTGEWELQTSTPFYIQNQIECLIHLDYDTFLNSAYLKQGQADVFTHLKPNDRIKVVRDILGISRYDQLSSMAIEKSKALQTEIQDYLIQIRQLEGQIADSPDTNTLHELNKRYIQLQTHVEEFNININSLKDRISHLLILQSDHNRLSQELKKLSVEESHSIEKHNDLTEQLSLMESLIASKAAIEQDYGMLQTVSAEILSLEPQVNLLPERRNEKNVLTNTIAQEKIKIEAELRQIKMQISQQMKQSNILSAIQKEINECSLTIQREGQSSILLDETEKRYTNERDLFQAMKSRSDRLKEEISEMQEVLNILQKTSGECPTCGADLQGEHKKEVTDKQLEKQRRLKQEHDELRSSGVEKKKTLNALEIEIIILRERCLAYNNASIRLKSLTQQVAELEKNIKTLKDDKKTEQLLETQITQEMFAQPSRIKLMQILKEISELEKVENKLQVLRSQRDSLVPCMERFQMLKSADKDYSTLLSEFHGTMKNIQMVQTEIDAKRKTFLTLSEQLTALPELQAELNKVESQYKDVQREKDTSNRQIGSIQSAMEAIQTAKITLKLKREQKKKIEEDRATYIELARAFGPDGIQNSLLENVLPEIEEEANALLNRISSGEMSLALSTNLLAKPSHGKQNNMLEITISDGLGSRPLEMFSGGEAFKISFALRISLSKLLASRSGACLKTLILDEGFGSQDGKGRERLVEVIEAVKQDFDKILLITHLDDLKNAFSQRIEIQKDSTGSHIRVIS